MPQIEFTDFGGGNWKDQRSILMRRSHTQTNIGFQNVAYTESPDLQNVDIIDRSIGKRRGSTARDSLASILESGETLIKGIFWRNSIQVIVGTKSIYTDQSGTWAQVKTSGGAAYTHSGVTRVSFVPLDGHLFICMDAGKIQVYRAGANLDAPLDNGNTYTEIYSGTNTVTGSWGTGYYIATSFYGRLVFSTGNSILEYTDVNQPWDLTGGGNFPSSGKVFALRPHVPQFGDSLSSILYIGTGVGWEFTSNLASASTIEGSPPTMSNKTVLTSKNWIMYLSADGGLHGINGNRVINLHSLENTAGGVLDVKISHRFGFISGGIGELFGIDQSTIRIGAERR